MDFKNIIGNDKVKQILNRTIELNKVTHSYLFVGPSGVGKTLFAKEFAKNILCLKETNPCDGCKSCLEFETNNHPDFIMIESEDSTIKIEQIRKMQEKVIEKPIISQRKIYVIKDADKMTKEAQNCLLKTLEEPPSYITIILIGANENQFLTTIKSRCTKIVFQPIEDKLLEQYLMTREGFENSNQKMISSFGGSIEKAEKMLQKRELYEQISQVFSNIEQINLIDAFQKLEGLYQEKESIFEILEYINSLLINKGKKDVKYLRYIETVEKTKQNLKANSNYDMSIDDLLYNIWEE